MENTTENTTGAGAIAAHNRILALYLRNESAKRKLPFGRPFDSRRRTLVRRSGFLASALYEAGRVPVFSGVRHFVG